MRDLHYTIKNMATFKFEFSILPTPFAVSFAIHRGKTVFAVRYFASSGKSKIVLSLLVDLPSILLNDRRIKDRTLL